MLPHFKQSTQELFENNSSLFMLTNTFQVPNVFLKWASLSQYIALKPLLICPSITEVQSQVSGVQWIYSCELTVRMAPWTWLEAKISEGRDIPGHQLTYGSPALQDIVTSSPQMFLVYQGTNEKNLGSGLFFTTD